MLRALLTLAVGLWWVQGPAGDRDELAEWRRAVGAPVYAPAPARWAGPIPALEDLVIVSWNAHLAEGRVEDLVDDLREGDLTGGKRVAHFVLLMQELFRRGGDVPLFHLGGRSARAIRARDPKAPDVNDLARSLGLAALYVPNMRNGAQLLEDRGNAIFSTEPLANAFAMELPLERQRRLAIGASIQVIRNGVESTLRIVDTHLEPLSSPRSLWVFRNPRHSQIGALLEMLSDARFEEDVAWAGTVLGGDFNTIQGGIDEVAYQTARRWGPHGSERDRRLTHAMGRIDYLFFRLPGDWAAATVRIDKRFGSDHYPVLGRFEPSLKSVEP